MCSVALDTCAVVIAVTEEAAGQISSGRAKDLISVDIVCTKDLNSDEVVEVHIDLGVRQINIKARIASNVKYQRILGYASRLYIFKTSPKNYNMKENAL